jgi:hypothetical protein
MSRKEMRKLLDAKLGARSSIDFWISQEFSLIYVFFVFLPAITLIVLLSPGSPLYFYASAVPLIAVYAQVFLSGIGVQPPWWVAFECFLSRLSQTTLPTLEAGEEILLTGYERTAGFLPKRGRLSLTNRRLIFQRPRLRFLPPWHAASPMVLRLDSITAVDAESLPSCRTLIRLHSPMPILTVLLRDGSRRQFGCMMARPWRRYILRARRDTAQGVYPVDA